MAALDAPTGEKGSVNRVEQYPSTGLPIPTWVELAGTDPTEYVEELAWPWSVQTYERMRNDSQVDALWHGTSWPLRRYTWALDPRQADPIMTALLADDLGIPVLGGLPVRGVERRFHFEQHLALGLEALLYGHYVFELVGEIEDGLWRLRKLAPRPPRTISKWEVDDDGGLKWVEQELGPKVVKLPVERLLVYCWQQEPGSWVGRSMLRAVYANWLLKDKLIRVDAVNSFRAGVGMPTITAPEGASQHMVDQLAQMATEYQAGERGGGAVPYGTELKLKGVEGSQPRTLESIRYHDEAMARSWLMMFIQLGQTQTGSRALGEAFIDWFSLAQQTIAEWFCHNFTSFLVADWFRWNVGEGEPIPALAYDPGQTSLSIDELTSLTSAGLIVPDPNLETELRTKYGLPESASPGQALTEPPPVVLNARWRRSG